MENEQKMEAYSLVEKHPGNAGSWEQVLFLALLLTSCTDLGLSLLICTIGSLGLVTEKASSSLNCEF